MKIATFNINGVKSRLPNLLAWLKKTQPDVVCLQELKALDGAFPHAELRAAGYGALWKGQRSWNGVAILARDAEPVEIRRELPGDPADDQSRYLEAAVNGVLVACLYSPNGNPQPGPKFDYKLAWFKRLHQHAKSLVASAHPVVLAGDFNVVPTDFDIYNPKSWRRDALLQPESRAVYETLLAQGWTDSLRHLHPDAAIYTFWDYFRQHAERDAGLRIDHLLLNAALAPRLKAAGVDRWVRLEAHASDHAPTWIELADDAGEADKADDAGKAVARKRSRSAGAAKAHPPARPAGEMKVSKPTGTRKAAASSAATRAIKPAKKVAKTVASAKAASKPSRSRKPTTPEAAARTPAASRARKKKSD